MKSVFIGFDFSMDKPACTILYDGKFFFFAWPLKITDKQVELYGEAGVFIRNRKWEPIKKPVKSRKKKKGEDVGSDTKVNNMIVLQHTIRSVLLANMIIADIDAFLSQFVNNDSNIYVASEGLSFGSKGDATMNLATYKGVLLAKLYEHYGDRLKGLYTYAPISLKSVAKCASKDDMANKKKMIDAFMREDVDCRFRQYLMEGRMINKTNYVPCVDDIVDSYWALITMLKKEKFIE